MSEKRGGFQGVLAATKAARVAADDVLTNADYDPESKANATLNEVLVMLEKAEGLAAQAHYWHGEESTK